MWCNGGVSIPYCTTFFYLIVTYNFENYLNHVKRNNEISLFNMQRLYCACIVAT